MKEKILKWVRKLDKKIINLYPEKSEISIIFLHKLFSNDETISQNLTMPHERLTVEEFDYLLGFFSKEGYSFISPHEIEELIRTKKNINRSKKNLLITFDDGYFNNSYALPILEKYNAPAIFFISTAYTKEKLPYWWDILYRERKREGKCDESILEEIEEFKKISRKEIYTFLIKKFGANCIVYQDLDRPFTETELKTFATHPLVYIGNHTHEHYALSYWNKETIRYQIQEAQNILEEIIGKNLVSKNLLKWFAYPNGSFDNNTLEVLEELNVPFALTIDGKKNYLPLRSVNKLQLGRINIKSQTLNYEMWKSYRHDKTPILESMIRKYILQQKIR